MGRERYRKAKDSRKAELLEANREKVLDETRDQFLDWLAGESPVRKEAEISMRKRQADNTVWRFFFLSEAD